MVKFSRFEARPKACFKVKKKYCRKKNSRTCIGNFKKILSNFPNPDA